ncbi:MAG: peptidylprolyl isomerase [Oscillospiraceae bacterium]|nr:peptidylprolyl isomerase [Oscillospiraceae bacterium]
MSEERKNPQVTIEMKNGGRIVIELYYDVAPNTVLNFVNLVNRGFYDGTVFHRVSPRFMIQGGCPDGTGSGGPGYSIKGEFSANGFENDLSHNRGVISMARAQHPDSAGSQFFIMTADSPGLDTAYASFGRVIDGMDVIDRIAAQDGPNIDGATVRPNEEQVMQCVTVETFGEYYDTPTTVG